MGVRCLRVSIGNLTEDHKVCIYRYYKKTYPVSCICAIKRYKNYVKFIRLYSDIPQEFIERLPSNKEVTVILTKLL